MLEKTTLKSIQTAFKQTLDGVGINLVGRTISELLPNFRIWFKPALIESIALTQEFMQHICFAMVP